MLDNFGESFHQQDEAVGGHGVSQPDTSRWVEGFSPSSIDEYLNGARGNAGHDKLYELGREVEELQGRLSIRPLYPIKSLFQVNLKDYVTQLTLHLSKMRDDFLNYDGMIRGSPIGKEAGLAVSYDRREERLSFIGNDFGDDLVNAITETNWLEVSETLGISCFRD